MFPTLSHAGLKETKLMLLMDAPLDIWRGGGARVLVACNLFFYLREKTIFFSAINVRQFFFYVSAKKFFVLCFPYYVGYHSVFFLVKIFFINFANKLFFCPHFRQTFVFPDFCCHKLFFSSPPPPPPPRYQMVRPLSTHS